MLSAGCGSFSRLFCRSYSSSANQVYSVWKKLNNKKGKGKSKWYEAQEQPVLLPATKLTERRGMGKQGIRRTNMLNKLFMRNITDLMAAGSMSEELLGNGVQISKVQITPDFNIVNVYWSCSDAEKMAVVEPLLKKAAGYLKNTLSQLRVMGIVPHIAFVKDMKGSQVSEVETLLGQIDYGDDYQPSNMANRLRSRLELQYSLPDEALEKIRTLEISNDEDEEEMPEMRHDVFGLDHSRIMEKVTRDVQKIQLAWETYESKKSPLLDEMPAVNPGISEEFQDKFKKYLATREFERRPRRKSWKRDEYEEDIVEDDLENFRDDDFVEEYDFKKH